MYESSWRKSLQFKEWSESNFLKCSAPRESLTDYVKTTWQSSSDESSEECYQLNLQLLLASLSFINQSAFCLAAWTQTFPFYFTLTAPWVIFACRNQPFNRKCSKCFWIPYMLCTKWQTGLVECLSAKKPDFSSRSWKCLKAELIVVSAGLRFRAWLHVNAVLFL